MNAPFNPVADPALTLSEWGRQWERPALYGFVQHHWGPPSDPSSLDALYGAAGLADQVALIQAASPFAALIAGGIAAAIREVVCDPSLPGRQNVIAWLTTPLSDPAPPGSVAAAVRRASSSALLLRPRQTERHPEAAYPPHWSAEDRAVWRGTDGGARVAVSTAILDAARQRLLDMPSAASRPVLDRVVMPRLAALRAMVERAMDDAGWDLAERRSAARSFTINAESAHALITRIFGRDVRLGYRCIRLALRMLDSGILDADRYAPIDYWRRRAHGAADWTAWDALVDALWLGGPRIVHPAFCIVSKPPEVLVYDEQDRPHATNGPFCRWTDGSALYAVHGAAVSARLFMAPETIMAGEIDREANADIQRVMIEQFGPARYLKDGGAVAADHESGVGTLYRRAMGDGETLAMVEVINATQEADGSFRHFWLRVPPSARTAREGVAWTFGLSSEDYLPVLET